MLGFTLVNWKMGSWVRCAFWLYAYLTTIYFMTRTRLFKRGRHCCFYHQSLRCWTCEDRCEELEDNNKKLIYLINSKQKAEVVTNLQKQQTHGRHGAKSMTGRRSTVHGQGTNRMRHHLKMENKRKQQTHVEDNQEQVRVGGAGNKRRETLGMLETQE